MPKPKMTENLARAIAHDTANQQMRKAGRSSWSCEDYALAIKIFDKLWPYALGYPMDSPWRGANSDDR